MEYNIYCDESSTTAKRYMLIGGLWVPWYAERPIRVALQNVREEYALGSEMKWIKVSQSKLSAYKEFVDTFICAPGVSFKCIVLDTRVIDYKRYHNNDKDLGFYKFYYLVISRNLKPWHLYWLYPDNRTARRANSLQILRGAVNGYCLSRGAHQNVLQAIEPRDSKQDDLLQVADIVLGAVACEWNKDTTNSAKLELAEYIKLRTKAVSLATGQSNGKLNIWAWNPFKGQSHLIQSNKRPIP